MSSSPGAFWLPPDFDVDVSLNAEELEAKAEKDCYLCHCLLAMLEERTPRGNHWIGKISKRDWGMSLCPDDLVRFRLEVELQGRGMPSITQCMFGWRQKLIDKFEPSSNSGCAFETVDEVA